MARKTKNIAPYDGIPMTLFLQYASQEEKDNLDYLPPKKFVSLEDFPDDTPLWNMCHGDETHEHMEDDSWLEELPDDDTPEDTAETFADFLPPDEFDEADTWLEAAEAELEKLEKEVACFDINETIPTRISFINIEPMIPCGIELKKYGINYKRSRHGCQKPRYKTWDRWSYQRFQKQFAG